MRFPVITVGNLVENLLVCGVLFLSHRGTPHTIGAKRLNLGLFCPHVCGLSHFEDLITFTFIHLADTFIQSDLQLRNTISDTL